MATRQGIDSNLTNRLGADHQILFIAVKAEFDSGTLRFWTGDSDITLNSENYVGAGTLLNVSNITEDTELKSDGTVVTLSGMNSDVINMALTENYQNRPITIFLGYMMGGTDVSAGELTLFKGRMVNLSIEDDPNGATVFVSCENRLVDLERPSNLRYTKETQNFLYPNDVGLDRVQSLQDKEIRWGAVTSGTSSGGGGGGSGGTTRYVRGTEA